MMQPCRRWAPIEADECCSSGLEPASVRPLSLKGFGSLWNWLTCPIVTAAHTKTTWAFVAMNALAENGGAATWTQGTRAIKARSSSRLRDLGRWANETFQPPAGGCPGAS